MTTTTITDAEVEAACKEFWEHPDQYGDERASWGSLPALEASADIGPVQQGMRSAMRAALAAAAQAREAK